MTAVTNKLKVLVVEDDSGISELIKTILEGENFEVYICSNGQGVNQAVEKTNPDLILLDLWIPGLNGESVTLALKRKKATQDIPIVIISAQSNLASVVSKIKADDFIAKPFDLHHLVTVVKKYTSKQKELKIV